MSEGLLVAETNRSGGPQAACQQASIGVSYTCRNSVELSDGFCWLPCHVSELAVRISVTANMRLLPLPCRAWTSLL
jgi:hypothetical protein